MCSSPTSAARIDPGLLRALAQALGTVCALHARATALAELGDIELPDSTPTTEDAQHLQGLTALYLAHELEATGLLHTAELVAGLFASGAIMQPLGPTAQLIAEFWRTRHARLAQTERDALFAQVFDAESFYPLMLALCDALAGQLNDPARPGDVRARVALQQAGEALAGLLAPRAGGMLSYAAQDIVQAMSQATRFLRDRLLQTAFGVHDLWGLVGTVNQAQGSSEATLRRRVDLGRDGAAVLAWLVAAIPQGFTFDPDGAEGQRVMAAAEGWRGAWRTLDAAASLRSLAWA